MRIDAIEPGDSTHNFVCKGSVAATGKQYSHPQAILEPLASTIEEPPPRGRKRENGEGEPARDLSE